MSTYTTFGHIPVGTAFLFGWNQIPLFKLDETAAVQLDQLQVPTIYATLISNIPETMECWIDARSDELAQVSVELLRQGRVSERSPCPDDIIGQLLQLLQTNGLQK